MAKIDMTSIGLRPPRLLPYEYRDRIHIFPPHEPAQDLPPLNREYVVTSSGRKAISLILEERGLQPCDEVWVVTTFNKPNVSSCVTSTIFNYCKPSRVLSESTRAILVIHEFGVPYPQIMQLRFLCHERHIPLIEDCAHTVDSRWPDGTIVGSVGDYVIYSLSKLFPIACGGLVFGLTRPPHYDPEEKRIVDSFTANLPSFWVMLSTFSARRRSLLKRALEQLGNEDGVVTSFSENITPWFLPVLVSAPTAVLRYLRDQQIECGLWYGSNIIVLPLHQYLTDVEMDFMVSHILTIEQAGKEKKQ